LEVIIRSFQAQGHPNKLFQGYGGKNDITWANKIKRKVGKEIKVRRDIGIEELW
jgi:hypothetical protein